MGRPAIDITGQRFGRLVVVDIAARGYAGEHVRWRCRCDCGSDAVVQSHVLRGGQTKSCGCLYAEVDYSAYGKTHGMSHTPEYKAWASMIARCEYERGQHYRHYGGRGIKVCEEWRTSFAKFYEHIGPKPTKKHSIDRIDNEGHYEPGNVRWATQSEQLRNRRKYKRNA